MLTKRHINKRKHWEASSETLVPIGQRLKEVRERAGYKTPGELAKAIRMRGGSISRQYIRYIENSGKRPSLRKLTLILDACGVTPSDFLGADMPVSEDVGVLGARVRQAREAAGYETSGQLWNAIRDRGGNITRQDLYRLELGQHSVSLKKLIVILNACGVSMDDFLGTDLVIRPRRDSEAEQKKLVTMLTKIREVNGSLAHVLESAIIRAFNEVSGQAKTKDDHRGAQ